MPERFEITYEKTTWGWWASIYDKQEHRYVVFKRWSFGGRDRAARRVAAIIAGLDQNYIKVAV